MRDYTPGERTHDIYSNHITVGQPRGTVVLDHAGLKFTRFVVI